MPQLRQAATASPVDAGDRLQGIGLVQDRQPARREERLRRRGERRQEGRDEVGRQERDEDRDERRDEARDEGRQEARDEGVGEAGAEERRRILTSVRALVRDAGAVATSFAADEGSFLAGGIAYQLFFALIPLLALVVGLVGFLYGAERAERELVQLLRSIYPSATDQETRIARELVEGRAVSLGFGVVGTILGARAIHGAIASAFAVVLGRGKKRSFVRGQVEALAFVAGAVLLAVASFTFSYGAVAAQGAFAAAGLAEPYRILVGLVSPFLGLIAGYVLFYCIYRFLPQPRAPRATVWLAALVSAVLWELAKIAFGLFTRVLDIFSAYGPIAFAAGLLTWIYVTAVIILIGAEVIKTQRASA